MPQGTQKSTACLRRLDIRVCVCVCLCVFVCVCVCLFVPVCLNLLINKFQLKTQGP